jgi:hypothetical protein
LTYTYAAGDVKTWNVDNVAEWLELLGMGKFQDSFKTNEITGPVLLELGLDDLDYMQITALGSRKVHIVMRCDDRRKTYTLCNCCSFTDYFEGCIRFEENWWLV